MAKYSAFNIVRDESGGLSIAGRSSDRIYTEQTVDIEAVWLGYDERTSLDTDMRVSIARMADGCPQTTYLIDPLDPRLDPEAPSDFEAIRKIGLIGVGAVRAYVQLPQQDQERLKWIVEDRSQNCAGHIGMVPEMLAIQSLCSAKHDPSAAECLMLFDYALRNVRAPSP